MRHVLKLSYRKISEATGIFASTGTVVSSTYSRSPACACFSMASRRGIGVRDRAYTLRPSDDYGVESQRTPRPIAPRHKNTGAPATVR